MSQKHLDKMVASGAVDRGGQKVDGYLPKHVWLAIGGFMSWHLILFFNYGDLTSRLCR